MIFDSKMAAISAYIIRFQLCAFFKQHISKIAIYVALKFHQESVRLRLMSENVIFKSYFCILLLRLIVVRDLVVRTCFLKFAKVCSLIWAEWENFDLFRVNFEKNSAHYS